MQWNQNVGSWTTVKQLVTLAVPCLTFACTDPAGPTAVPTDASMDKPVGTTSTIECDPDNGGLTLPAGFCALVVVKDVGRARHMAVRPNGDLYVAIDNAPGGVVGHILALRDTDGDGRPDEQAQFGDNGGNGIAWSEGRLYFAPNDRVFRYTLSFDELLPTPAPELLVSGLPVGGDHPRKTIVLDAKGNMFVNHASASNNCQLANRQL